MDGRRVVRTETGNGVFLTCAFEFVGGTSPSADQMTDEQLNRWGMALSELHRITAERPTDNPGMEWSNFGRHELGYLVSTAASVIADRTPGGIGREAHHEYRNIVSWLNSFPQEVGVYGLIHFDFEPDNIIWTDSGPTIVDFDDCAIGWRFADIAFAVRSLFPDGRPADTGRYRVFMEGYGFRWSDAREIARLFPRFLRVHAFIMLGRLLRAVDLDRGSADRGAGDLAEGSPAEAYLVPLVSRLELAIETFRKRLGDPRVWTHRPGRVSSRRSA